MTLDAAIQHAKEVAVTQNNQDCIKCAEEHEQLAEWLEELKEYQQLEEQGRLVKLPCKVGDVDKVVEKLESEKKVISCVDNEFQRGAKNGHNCALNMAIEIVKRGGADER